MGVIRVDVRGWDQGVCWQFPEKIERPHKLSYFYQIVKRNVPADLSWNGDHFGRTACVGVSQKKSRTIMQNGDDYRIIKRNVPKAPSWNGDDLGLTA